VFKTNAVLKASFCASRLLCPFAAVRLRRNGQAETSALLKKNCIVDNPACGGQVSINVGNGKYIKNMRF